MGGNYKAGSYKGLDLSFGRPGKAIGGILIRSIMQVSVSKSSKICTVEKSAGKDAFIEGPCLCVDRILKQTGAADIKSLVATADFNLSAFDQKSNFHILCTGVVMVKRDIESCARVGLTLKKLDANKP